MNTAAALQPITYHTAAARALEDALRDRHPRAQFHVAADPENDSHYTIFCGADGDDDLMALAGDLQFTIGFSANTAPHARHALSVWLPVKFRSADLLETCWRDGLPGGYLPHDATPPSTPHYSAPWHIQPSPDAENYGARYDEPTGVLTLCPPLTDTQTLVETVENMLAFVRQVNLEYLRREYERAKQQSVVL